MASSPLKILLILIEPPLPFGNAGSRWFHVLYQQLLDRGHDVDVVVASGSERDIKKAHEVFKDKKYKIHVFPFMKNTSYLQKIKSFISPHKAKFSDDFYATLKPLQEKADIIHIEQTWAGWTSLDWTNKSLINVHFLQSIDLDGALIKSLKEQFFYKRLFAVEKHILSKYPYIRTCTPRLEKVIKSWRSDSYVQSVAFGIDSHLYPFIESSKRQNDKPIISLIGNMGWHPSLSAAKRLLEDLWPKIKQRVPNTQCQIVGWNARTALKNYLHLKDVNIIENVDDIAPYFNQSSLMLYAPTQGSGMKIKVQESMLFGVPVVTTMDGIEGLPAKDMIHCGVSNESQGLIDRSVEILNSIDLQERLRIEARQLILEHCNPKTTVDEIEKIYHKILLHSSNN